MGWIMPVGTPGGINSGMDDIGPASGLVRLGDRLISMDGDHYRLWRAAAAAPETEHLQSWAEARGIVDVDDRIKALVAAEVAVTQGTDVRESVGRLAVRLIGEFIGNGAEPRRRFLVVGRNDVSLTVDASLFEVLLRSDGVSSLSETCDRLAASGARQQDWDLLGEVADSLPLLVRSEVVLLDASVR